MYTLIPGYTLRHHEALPIKEIEDSSLESQLSLVFKDHPNFACFHQILPAHDVNKPNGNTDPVLCLIISIKDCELLKMSTDPLLVRSK